MKFLILISNLFFFNFSFADENGISFWFSGQFASLIAYPSPPGWGLGNTIYYENTKQTYPNTNQEIKSSIPYFFLEPIYSLNSKWFGGHPSFSISQGIGYNYTSTILPSRNYSQSFWGLSDMYPYGEINWNRKNHYWNVYMMGGIPIGFYNKESISNLGTGHFSIDLGFGYTYFNKTSGIQTSGLLGFTNNFINPSTDYKNGVDSHLDYSLSKFLKSEWEAGIVGYVYYQLTGDSGSGAVYGSNKSKAAAIGPLGSYSFKSGPLDMNASLRGYWDFWEENRPGGLSIYAVLKIQFPN